jgi:FkbM family methyltransferase
VEVSARVLQKLNAVEMAVAGDRGIITGSAKDQIVLPWYGVAGTFSSAMTEAIVNYFRHDIGTYVDVGANIGLTVIPFARLPNVRCLAFEPALANYDFLCRNVNRNAPGADIECINKAIFIERGTMSLALAEENFGDHRLTHEGIAGRKSIEVETVPLDDYLPLVKGKLAIKIDTQGAEPFVVASGREIIARAGLIAIEFCPYLMRQLKGDPEIVIDTISKCDRVAVMRGGENEPLHFVKSADAVKILREKIRMAADSDGDYWDVLACRD